MKIDNLFKSEDVAQLKKDKLDNKNEKRCVQYEEDRKTVCDKAVYDETVYNDLFRHVVIDNNCNSFIFAF